MKKTNFLQKTLLLVAMIGWAVTANAQRYETDHGRVYFGSELVVNADVRSFEDLGCGYAKDRNNVYMMGRVLVNVDPRYFRLKERSVWSRHNGEQPVQNRGYYKTKWNVYFGDRKLDAMPSTFKELGGGYAKDAFNVYYYGDKVEGAVASSFKYTRDGYAEDAFDAYYRGRKLK